MRKIIFTLFAAGFTNLVSAAVPPLKAQIVASGFDRPLFATAPNGDPRLFVVEQGGLVKVMQNGVVLPTPFLDLSAKVDTTGERGLLGMAFDPSFETNRRFYVDYI
jgi:glucose/arabinose dehydrogenase